MKFPTTANRLAVGVNINAPATHLGSPDNKVAGRMVMKHVSMPEEVWRQIGMLTERNKLILSTRRGRQSFDRRFLESLLLHWMLNDKPLLCVVMDRPRDAIDSLLREQVCHDSSSLYQQSRIQELDSHTYKEHIVYTNHGIKDDSRVEIDRDMRQGRSHLLQCSFHVKMIDKSSHVQCNKNGKRVVFFSPMKAKS